MLLMQPARTYFIIAGLDRPERSYHCVGPVCTEDEIIEVAKVPADSPAYDGEPLDAALEKLNDGYRVFNVFDVETDGALFLSRALELGLLPEAQKVIDAWQSRTPPPDGNKETGND